jgi:hypothetical protein
MTEENREGTPEQPDPAHETPPGEPAASEGPAEPATQGATTSSGQPEQGRPSAPSALPATR